MSLETLQERIEGTIEQYRAFFEQSIPLWTPGTKLAPFVLIG